MIKSKYTFIENYLFNKYGKLKSSIILGIGVSIVIFVSLFIAISPMILGFIFFGNIGGAVGYCLALFLWICMACIAVVYNG